MIERNGAAPEGVNRVMPQPRQAEDLDAHEKRFGRRPTIDPASLTDDIERSGLRGRGGAAFPVATKWRAVTEHRSAAEETVLVANAAEGEPASAKDRTVLSLRPHLILDGLAHAAEAIGATRVVIYISRTYDEGQRAVQRALAERRDGGERLQVEMVTGPYRYVSGEETAVVARVSGRQAKPRVVPPRPFQHGVRGSPTLVHNVETLAHVALIARFGSAWFRSKGTATSPGTALFSVSGAVRAPQVLEAAFDETVGNIVERAGGTSSEPQAVLTGGYFGRWVPADRIWPVRVEAQSLRAAGVSSGTGVIVVLPRSACGITESARVLEFLAAQSAGQCGPCHVGLPAMSDCLWALVSGSGSTADLERLVRWSTEVRGRGACRHPDGASLLLGSALDVFAADLRQHIRNGRCAGARQTPTLPIPTMDLGWR